jgi:hypothetical protein
MTCSYIGRENCMSEKYQLLWDRAKFRDIIKWLFFWHWSVNFQKNQEWKRMSFWMCHFVIWSCLQCLVKCTLATTNPRHSLLLYYRRSYKKGKECEYKNDLIVWTLNIHNLLIILVAYFVIYNFLQNISIPSSFVAAFVRMITSRKVCE